jgi:mycothiol synthase
MNPIYDILAGLRPFADGDIQELAGLMYEARAWPPPFRPAPEDILARWRRRHIHPHRDVSVLWSPQGRMVAYMLATAWREGMPRMSFELGVHPDFRRRGIGSALLDRVVMQCRREGLHWLTSPVYRLPGEQRHPGAEFLEHRGFSSEHHYWMMMLEDIASQPPPRWPSSITWRHFTDIGRDAEVWAELVRVIFNEAAPAESYAKQVREPGSDPKGYFFALDASTDTEVGTCRVRIDLMGGRPVGYIGTVGVLPEYRGRGIATALIQHALHYLSGLGIDTATLFVEERNSPARTLYARLGWRDVYRTDHYWRSIL